jgi:hypothetical protein
MKHLALILILLSAPAALADVPPDPGYVRQSADLILESDADLSGFRFFLDSPMKIEEIKIAKGAPTTIEASGRAGAMRLGKLIAIPVKEFDQYAGTFTEDELRRVLHEKKFPGAKELLSHDFQWTISESERSSWKDPVYRISVSNGVIEATKVAGGTSSAADPVVPFSFRRILLPIAIGGVLLAAAVAILGIWLIRRSTKKV